MDELYKYYQLGVEMCWAEQLDSNGRPRLNVYNNRFLDAIGLIAEKKSAKFSFLDVGCGIGIYSLNILKKYGKSNACCFDLSKAQVAFAKKLFEKNGLKNRAKFFVKDAENFYFKNKFDYILCTEVLEHLIRPEKAIKNMVKCSKKGTIFIFSVPFSAKGTKEQWVYKQFSEEKGRLADVSESEVDKGREYFTFFHKSFSYADIAKLMKKNGLCIEKVNYSNAFFDNKYLDIFYNKLAVKKLDVFFNKFTNNKFASQITFSAKVL